MRIIIPVDEQSMNSTVSQSFGRTPFFLLYDTESKDHEFIDNSAFASQGGAGIKAAQSIVDFRANVLITPRCGSNATEVLHGAGVQIRRSQQGSVLENLKAYEAGQLPALTEVQKGHQHHGSH